MELNYYDANGLRDRTHDVRLMENGVRRTVKKNRS